MIKWNVGSKIAAGFAMALAILAIIGFVSYRGALKLDESAELVRHTHLIIESLGNVLSAMADVETSNRGFVITGEEKYLEPFDSGKAVARQEIKNLRDLARDDSEQMRRLDALEPLIESKILFSMEIIEARRDKTKGFEAALQMVLTDKGKTIMDGIRKNILEMRNHEKAILKVRVDETNAIVEETTRVIIGGTLAALVLMTVAGVVITRNIALPLRAISTTAERIASGDLSIMTPMSDRDDEVGILSRAFSRMAQTLRGQVGELVEGINVLGASASEISASTSQLAGNASESATSVSETTTTIEEVRQTAQIATQKAKLVSENARQASAASQAGLKSAKDVEAAMSRISQQMDAIATNMGKLSEQSHAIGQIIASVEDLAAQSNLLAVNAAIEAAKAGEHGKGFGVVAQEVKSLAEQSRQATSQVRALLGDIQKATTAAVMSTEQGGKAVEAGIRQTTVAAESINALAANVTDAANWAMQIAASSQQQLVGVDQVVTAMENIKQGTGQNVSSARQLESAARNLSELGQSLRQLVSHYKIEASIPA